MPVHLCVLISPQQAGLTHTSLVHCSNKRTVPAHAFLNFTSAADVLAFTVRMAGRSFGGEGAAKASQWRCTVEYAPHQRVPRAVGKPDNREGTLDKGEE